MGLMILLFVIVLDEHKVLKVLLGGFAHRKLFETYRLIRDVRGIHIVKYYSCICNTPKH